MTALAIRKKVLTYLADADDKKVKAIYTLFEKEIEEAGTFALSEEQLKILEERRSRHLNGQDKSYPWKEVHERIKNKRNKK
jgi:hypothetical protein